MNKKDPRTVIFIGKAGSGKGVQARLLVEHLGSNKTLYVYSGGKFRSLVKETKTHTTRLLKENVLDAGGLAPRFLAIWAWGDTLIREFSPHYHLVIDGSPRTLMEAQAFAEALVFYGREKNVFVVILDIPQQEVFRRLQLRGRHDDKKEAIMERLRWFDKNIPPIISYFKKKTSFFVIAVDGVGSEKKGFERITSAVI